MSCPEDAECAVLLRTTPGGAVRSVNEIRQQPHQVGILRPLVGQVRLTDSVPQLRKIHFGATCRFSGGEHLSPSQLSR